MEIPSEMLKSIFEQAQAQYPHECCGMILGPKENPKVLTALRPCQNVQDEYHAKDPVNFPRTAETAYFMDPRELLEIQKSARDSGQAIRVLYHSHVDHGAYFSEEDKRVALQEGEPAWPGVSYLVVSVIQGQAKDHHLFCWDPHKKDFLS